MRIEIDDRLRPFSHTPGTTCLIPGTFYSVRVFPCFLQIYDISKSTPVLVGEVCVKLSGPIEQFTVQQDLEKGYISVWGRAPQGFFRYCLRGHAEGKGIEFYVEKAPEVGLTVTFEGQDQFLAEKASLHFFTEDKIFRPYVAPIRERLSLGNNKAQDWDLVKRRLDPKEIIPVWHRLGHLIPATEPPRLYQGNLELLQSFKETFSTKKNDESMQKLMNLFRAGFEGILTPRLNDDDYQGLTKSVYSSNDLSPLVLVSEGSHLIRRLFVSQEGNTIEVLPFLPPELHYGRFLHIQLNGGSISLEWTKKIIRRVAFYAQEDQEFKFDFRHIRSFRLREEEGKEQKLSTGISISMEKNRSYYFDNFS